MVKFSFFKGIPLNFLLQKAFVTVKAVVFFKAKLAQVCTHLLIKTILTPFQTDQSFAKVLLFHFFRFLILAILKPNWLKFSHFSIKRSNNTDGRCFGEKNSFKRKEKWKFLYFKFFDKGCYMTWGLSFKNFTNSNFLNVMLEYKCE